MRDAVVFMFGVVPLWFCLDPVSLGVSDSKVLVLCVLPAFPCALKLLALRDKFTLGSKILFIAGAPSESSGGAPFFTLKIILVSVLERLLVFGTGEAHLA